ncbi:uncharacterized protein LOC34623889 [Cyclospora cayetanensis]|uniref:Uncharacterized protein LOC34623889 n=1 Tax=Cyclospora cayetanensis TaxID=88456 RepID=A0A6P6RVZ9_9EIME|nr:uncharacterized protein LOC34623889 [Cyclospora cayetanensis]
MTPLVRILLVVFAVVAIPVAALLDRLLRPSHAAAFYGRNHLRALIGLHQKGRHRLQREEASADNGTAFGSCTSGEQSSSPWLNRDEVMVIQGALDMASKNIGDFLVPLDEVYQLERSTKLTPNVMMQILRRGHSRIPIYEGDRHNIRGILLVKSLICIDPGAAYGEAWRDERSPPPDANLLGIVTMEDVIEQLLQADIMDEFDRKKTSRFAATRPTGGTLPLGSFGAEVASGEISPDGAQGAFFLAFSLSKELDTFPMGVTGTASAALAESTTRTHLSPLSLKAQADAPPSVHSVVEAATAPCMLDSASASGESAFGYAAVDVEQLAPLVGVYIHPKHFTAQMPSRSARSKHMQQTLDTAGRWLTRRCFTQPFFEITKQQQQQQEEKELLQQQQQEEEELLQHQQERETSTAEEPHVTPAPDAIPYGVILPSPRGARRNSAISNSSRRVREGRNESAIATPQVLCMSKQLAAVSVQDAAGSPLGDTLSASMRPKGYAEALMQPEHRDKEKHKKKRQPLPGAPDGGYAILPDLP